LVARGGTIKSFTFKDAVSLLEQHLNNKVMSEQMRHNEDKLQKEDYLECQKR